MAATAITYTFTAGTTARASEVNQNFTDLVNGLTDGTKDIASNRFTATTDIVTPQITGTTKLIGSLGIKSSTLSVTPDSLLHVFGAIVTGVTAKTGTLLTLEYDSTGGGTGFNLASFLSDASTKAGLCFGVDTDNDHGKFIYEPAGDFVFTVATKASVVVDRGGCLILNPGGTATYPATTYGIEIESGSKSKIKVSPTSGAGYAVTMGDPTDPIFNIQGSNSVGAINTHLAASDGSLRMTFGANTIKIPYWTV